MYLGDEDVLVAQMINFVEELPVEWQHIYRDMCLKAGREPVEGKRLLNAPI